MQPEIYDILTGKRGKCFCKFYGITLVLNAAFKSYIDLNSNFIRQVFNHKTDDFKRRSKERAYQ